MRYTRDERQNVGSKSDILKMFHNLKPRTIFISKMRKLKQSMKNVSSQIEKSRSTPREITVQKEDDVMNEKEGEKLLIQNARKLCEIELVEKSANTV